MLLKRIEKDNKIKAIYSSSNICASTYDKQNKDLIIIFNNGGQYKYSSVSETDFTRFELGDSQGNIFNSHIKKYSFEKLDKIDTKEILTEVELIKAVEDKAKTNAVIKSMFNKMKYLVTFYDTTNSIEPNLFEKLKIAISEYDKNI